MNERIESDEESSVGRRRRWWPVLLPICLLAVAVTLLSPAGRHQWALSLIRQRTNYTALSFNNIAALPSSAVAGQPMTVSFTVQNHEGQAVEYQYLLTQDAGGKSQLLKKSTKSIAAGASWSVTARVRPSCASSPCRIQVSLPGHPETVDFLFTMKAGQESHG
jgi:hypothetical protein